MKQTILFVLAVLGFPLLVHANPLELKVSEGSTVEFSLPYTMGTHHGTSSQVEAFVKIDPKTMNLITAVVHVPIGSLKTGNEERDCHLRESLGIDYSKSRFPKTHVCGKDNTLPKEGVDSVAYTEITFMADPTILKEGKNEINGTWTIHGVTKKETTSITVTHMTTNPLSIELDGEHIFSLKNFEVTVKPFLFIKVKDRATAKFHLSLVP